MHVVNGLTDLFHPMQVLSDLFTMVEAGKDLRRIKVAFVGDGNNVCNSLICASILFEFCIYVASPCGYSPSYKNIFGTSGRFPGNVVDAGDPVAAVKGADVVYTDVWVSMGKEKELSERKKAFKKYQINTKLLSYAKKDCIVMHCLPAHRGEEITDEVIDGRNSIVFKQAENRLHTQKALFIDVFNR